MSESPAEVAHADLRSTTAIEPDFAVDFALGSIRV